MIYTITRTISIKLRIDGHEDMLGVTQRAFNEAATWIAQICWDEGVTNMNTAHHRVYGDTREASATRASIHATWYTAPRCKTLAL
jgi:hypothetical protein